MADNRKGGDDRRDGWRDRDSSIFSDGNDDRWGRGSGRWSSDHGRHAGPDDRGFFERAGDEVRSWFGDTDSERRPATDTRNNQGRSGPGGSDYGRQHGQDQGRQQGWRSGSEGEEYRRSPYGGQQDYERSSHGGWGSPLGDSPDRNQMAPPSGGSSEQGRERGGYGESGFGQSGFHRSPGQAASSTASRAGAGDPGGRQDQSGTGADWDDNYRRWRQQQLQQFDSEYEDYRRERQQHFEQDFDNWRSSRLTQGGTASHFGSPGEPGREGRSEQSVQPSDPSSGQNNSDNLASTEKLGSSTGFDGSDARKQGSATALGAGSISSAGGRASATTASTGSTGAEAEQSGRHRSRTRS